MKERTAIGIIIAAICTFIIGAFLIFRYTSTSFPIPTGSGINALSYPQTDSSGKLQFGNTYIAEEFLQNSVSVNGAISIGGETAAETEIQEVQEHVDDPIEIRAMRDIYSTEIQELTVQIDALTTQREEYREAVKELALGFSENFSELQMRQNKHTQLYEPKPTQDELDAYIEEESNIYSAFERFSRTYVEESQQLVQLLNDAITTRRKLYNERLLLQDLLKELDLDD